MLHAGLYYQTVETKWSMTSFVPYTTPPEAWQETVPFLPTPKYSIFKGTSGTPSPWPWITDTKNPTIAFYETVYWKTQILHYNSIVINILTLPISVRLGINFFLFFWQSFLSGVDKIWRILGRWWPLTPEADIDRAGTSFGHLGKLHRQTVISVCTNDTKKDSASQWL